MKKEKILFLLLFLMVFTVGFFIRVARFPDIPPGLNQDEANSATETYSLIETGKDKWGNKYPAYFPSWGSGQSVLMAYLSMPVVKIFVLTIFSTRLVPVLLGILTLPLFFFCLLPFGRYAALLGMLILSVVPWHFMMSRWALECNLLPFFMLLGCGTLSYALATQEKKWIVPSLIPFALSLYSYGTTIIVLSVFLVLVVILHYKLFLHQLKAWLTALALFILMAFPFTLFFLESYILKRNLTWTDSLFFSTPICPANRFDQTSSGSWRMVQNNIEFLFSGCNDGTDYNMMKDFSVLLPFLMPLSFIALICGIYSLYKSKTKRDSSSITLSIFISWLLSSLALVMLFELNINRFNNFFIPCIALAVWVIRLIPSTANSHLPKYSIRIGIAVLLSLESFLAIRYYFSDYPDSSIKRNFNDGLEEAFYEVKKLKADQVRITDRMPLPYAYTLFYTQYSPELFQREAAYEIQGGAYKVNHFGKYVFYEEYLDKKKGYAYLSRRDEFHGNENQQKTVVFTNEDWEVGRIE